MVYFQELVRILSRANLRFEQHANARLQYKNSNKGIKGRGKGRKVEILRMLE